MIQTRFAGIFAAALLVILSPAEAANTAAINEVLKLKAAGMGEETIVAFIKSKNLNYELSADDAIALSKQGVPAGVLNAMFTSGQDTLPPAVTQAAPAAAASTAQPTPAPVAPSPALIQPAVVAQPVLSPEAAYFYQELSPYGRWILAEDNQWYWQPTEVVLKPDWRPYWDRGHWVYTDNGWYWASDYPWGWAAFHYGRWQLHPHHGWLWFPDRVWAPAWVLWRSGGDYCGWAPLPPGAYYDVHAGRFSYRGKVVEASFDFGLDWLHFNFTFVREMGEQPRTRFHKEQELRAVYRQTTVINHFSVIKVTENHESRERLVNHGIDPARVAAVKGRPIEPVKINDRRAPLPNHDSERLDRRGKTLEVYRPRLPDHSRR